MKVLMVKTSSMGDVIHALPAVTDARRRYPNLQLDWVVEQHYAPIVGWHPAVSRVIPIQLRQWRRQPWSALRSGAVVQAWRQLRNEHYDLVIDAQGLLKSLLWVLLSRRQLSCGYDRSSIRGQGVSGWYGQRAQVSWELSAVERIRHLFAQALDYPVPTSAPDYGIVEGLRQTASRQPPSLICFPNSSCANRYWPVAAWQQLIQRATAAGFVVQLSAGSARELAYCQQIAAQTDAQLLNQYSITQLGTVIANATAVISLDTGLGHLATAMHKPTITLHGPTRLAAPDQWQTALTADLSCAPCLKRICPLPEVSAHDIAPCLASISVDTVWQALQRQCLCS